VELIYARWLAAGTRAALATLIATFLAYLYGFAEPLVPPGRLAGLWHLPVGDFRAATGAPAGWDWLAHAGWSDYTNMIGVAMLCLVSLVCYLRVLFCPGEALLRVLAVAQVLVLVAAASGLLPGAH
jgi:hypothetical protein